MEEDKTALSFLNTNLLPITSIPDNNIVDKSFQLVNQNKHINANESSVDNIIKSDDEEIHDDALDFDLSKEVNKVDTDIKNGDPNFHYG
ncbi:6251_t:CDS:1, partial [Rhizophagus irregularis]